MGIQRGKACIWKTQVGVMFLTFGTRKGQRKGRISKATKKKTRRAIPERKELRPFGAGGKRGGVEKKKPRTPEREIKKREKSGFWRTATTYWKKNKGQRQMQKIERGSLTRALKRDSMEIRGKQEPQVKFSTIRGDGRVH